MTSTVEHEGAADTSPTAPRSAPIRSRLASAQLSRFTGLGLWAVFIVIFAIWIPDTFLTATTVKSIAGDQAITAILAIGVLFTLAAGVYDLSIAQNLGLGAVVVSSLMVKSHVDPALAVAIALALGAAIGAVNGFLVAVVGVNSFIATLAMSSVLVAATSKVSNDEFIGPLPTSFTNLAAHEPLGIPMVTIWAVVLGLIAWYALEHTPLGRRIYATGANPDAARLAGVRTSRHVFGGFVVTGTVAALAGVVAASKIGSVSPDLGPPYLLPAFAACFLGTTQIKLGRFNVWGTFIALYLLATGVKGLQLVGGQLWITDLFNGVALAGAVSLAVVSTRRRKAATART